MHHGHAPVEPAKRSPNDTPTEILTCLPGHAPDVSPRLVDDAGQVIVLHEISVADWWAQ